MYKPMNFFYKVFPRLTITKVKIVLKEMYVKNIMMGRNHLHAFDDWYGIV